MRDRLYNSIIGIDSFGCWTGNASVTSNKYPQPRNSLPSYSQKPTYPVRHAFIPRPAPWISDIQPTDHSDEPKSGFSAKKGAVLPWNIGFLFTEDFVCIPFTGTSEASGDTQKVKKQNVIVRREPYSEINLQWRCVSGSFHERSCLEANFT